MIFIHENLSLKSFVVLMKATKSIEQRVKQDIRNYDMTTSEFTILEVLYHKGKQTVQEISNAVLIKSGSITYVIDKLEKKELIQREHSKSDRRVVHIQITQLGNKLMNEIFPLHQQVIEGIFEDVQEDEKKALIHILKKVGLTVSKQLNN